MFICSFIRCFRFRRTSIKVEGNPIFLNLNNSPKRQTIERKLKQLPVRYMRLYADNEEEQLLRNGLQCFKSLNFDDDNNSNTEETTSLPPPTATAATTSLEQPPPPSANTSSSQPPRRKKLKKDVENNECYDF